MANVVESPDFYEAQVVTAWDETPSLRGLRLLLPEPVARLHAAPGQVVMLRVANGAPGHFALASAPGNPRAELLLRRGGRLAEALVAHAVPGARLELTAPLGRGF
ncbi:MAG: oxidoreductase, partial [Deltaproteobacteria bacterium]